MKYNNSVTNEFYSEMFDQPETSNEKNIELLKRAKKGDLKAKEELILCNLKLIRSAFHKFGIDEKFYDDFIQESYLSFEKAINNFDLAKSINFSTYLYKVILRNVYYSNISYTNIINVPEGLKLLCFIYRRERAKAKNDGLEYSDAEACKFLKINQDRLEIIKKMVFGAHSLDNLPGDRYLGSDEDVFAEVHEDLTPNMLEELLYTTPISERQLFTIAHRYGLYGCPIIKYDDIAKFLGNVSKQRIMQLDQRALSNLRANDKFSDLKEYLNVGSTNHLHKSTDREYRKKPVKSLIDVFYHYDKEIVLSMFSKLTIEEQGCIRIVFGNNLDTRTDDSLLSSIDKQNYYKTIIKLYYNLAKEKVELNDLIYKEYKPLLEMLKAYSINEILNVINSFSEYDQQEIYEIFGKDLMNVKIELNDNYKRNRRQELIGVLKSKLEVRKGEFMNQLLESFRNKDLTTLGSLIDVTTLAIIDLKLKGVDNAAICAMFRINELELAQRMQLAVITLCKNDVYYENNVTKK